MMKLLFLSIICVISFSLTFLLRRYAISRQILDIPNHRSAHQTPTPRGGGLAFVIVMLTYLLCCGMSHELAGVAYPVLAIAAMVLVAIAGWVDDVRSLSARTRLLVHFAAAILLLLSFYALPDIAIGKWNIPQGILLKTFLVFYLVWMLNLYNFMDGIDGLAGLEAFTVCLSMGFIYYWHGGLDNMLPLAMAAAVLGFLLLNLPPARIFMGDAGSGFLGFVLAFFSLQAAVYDSGLFWSWLVMMDVFILDASITLFQRLLSGQKLSEAHSSHAYQHAARFYSSHRQVSYTVALINLLWLLPWALLSSFGYIGGFWAFICASMPLVYLILIFNPGKASSSLENERV